MNYKLWHTEDIARRKDVTPCVTADCKYRIDRLNQKRTDFYEKIDESIIELLTPCLPEICRDVQNTESPGMAVDRMSILALKIYHMKEQAMRSDVGAEHIKTAKDKLQILESQRHNLIKAVKHLIDEYLTGRKTLKAFYQMKMYNDPNLNPQLYGGR